MVKNQFDYEFHTIILAAGRGSRMNHILHGRPKCLLQIANRPMIQYSLELLQRHHIQEAFIIVLDNEEHQIKNAVTALGLDIQLRFVTIPHAGDYATADSLRAIQKQEKLTKDILLVSCDLVADIDLEQFIQLYRLRNASFLCAFSSQCYPKENLMPAIKLADNCKEFDYIGLDGNDSNRLVFFEPDVMFTTDSIPLKRSILECCPYFQLRTDLIDSHIYLFRNWILDYLQHETGIRSIKFDLLPSLVRKQFRRQNSDRSTESSRPYENDEQSKKSKRFIDFIQIPELETYMADINLNQIDNENHEKKSKSSLINCVALIIDTGHLVRVNNLLGFCQANRFLIDQKSISNNSLINHNSKLGEKTMLKRTVIGNNCKIGDQCHLTNCIIQDNATIENGCQLINSVICSDVYLEGNVVLENCIVGPRYRVGEKSHYRNESLIQEMLDLI
ncbi:hypothetical protein HUG17_8519 [Dermatophagoides farinae]|nr:hypothetical protein HUG17_8519 [Dermatophagoides farinae]